MLRVLALSSPPYHAVQAELLRLSAENQSLKQAVQEKDHRIACTQADLEQAHKRCEELEHRNNMLLRQQRQAKQGHEYDSILAASEDALKE